MLRSSHAIQHGSGRPALDRHALAQLLAAWLTAMQLRRTDQSADGCVRRLKVRLSCFLALALPVRIRSAPKNCAVSSLVAAAALRPFGVALSSFSSGCLASGRRAWLCLAVLAVGAMVIRTCQTLSCCTAT